ncbi:IncA protein [Chlamydia serpentis]|uniref:IncA protein n=1 Tax=Chlamydia serpentis TaxID=1967782 RepID=A0A2R8FA77_9CHLA|nr:hypothetical protein [Chlamydia serpentis]SPN73330.1 IncA protein [Chlamydia serpentis]
MTSIEKQKEDLTSFYNKFQSDCPKNTNKEKLELHCETIKKKAAPYLVKISKTALLANSVIFLIAGIILLALAASSILSLMPYLVIGILLTALSAIILISMVYFFKLTTILSFTKSNDKEISEWIKQQRAYDILLEKENPEEYGADVLRLPFKNISPSKAVRELIAAAESSTLKTFYADNAETILFIFWNPKNMFWNPKAFKDNINHKSEEDIRNVLGGYTLLKNAKALFSTLVNETFEGIKTGDGLLERCSQYRERAKTTPYRQRALFCLTYSCFRDGRLTPFRVIPSHMINSYLSLRQTHHEEDFFTPGHPCYYARLAFNEAVLMYRKLVNISELKKMFVNKDYRISQEGNLTAILNFVKSTDQGDEFLIEHGKTETEPKYRDSTDLFY